MNVIQRRTIGSTIVAGFPGRSLCVGLVLLAVTGTACGTEPPGPRPALTGKILFVTGWDVFAKMPGHIEVMNADGSVQIGLTNDAAGDSDPAWSPDGTKIAFTRGLVSDAGAIYVMNADGSAQTRLTSDASASDYSPAWSPDGKRLVFVRGPRGAGDCYGVTDNQSEPQCAPSIIYVMSVDGSGVTRLTYPPARQIDGLNIQDYSPAWSPDAKRIAFVRGAPGVQSSIYVMRADGTGTTRITTDEKVGDYYLEDDRPAWSPNGKQIAFSRSLDGTNIYVMSPNGSELKQLTKKGGTQPTWSPSGAAIAFVSERDTPVIPFGPEISYASEIYVMNANGTGVIRITHDDANDVDPSWSRASA